ncbi:hypothetical protein Cob_v001574 [Colletotrichum orbiculare MAFF 240422]|uniref:Uncharacterized protein n=1 Tax=Colletotrichum orbiculare (strain 104-T / ATCC 96160 / CBS 514.97 / LARS 414 / MAFF 240422) TaxID=1213857 RepID=A0A484G759_COLOR|nr:hypothetical protein Cob_v001574 [Colletotrichum orbiculare MAFF 240422]
MDFQGLECEWKCTWQSVTYGRTQYYLGSRLGAFRLKRNPPPPPRRHFMLFRMRATVQKPRRVGASTGLWPQLDVLEDYHGPQTALILAQ